MDIGDRVKIVFNIEGTKKETGTVRKLFRSGRVLVDLDAGGFRNFRPEWLHAIFESTFTLFSLNLLLGQLLAH